MKVLLAGSGLLPVPPPGHGAVERHVAALADALRRHGHEVEIFAPVIGEWRFAWRLARRFRRTRPDVLHVHTTAAAAFLGARGVPFVYTSHSRHWRSAEGARERAGFALERFACRRATAVVALTPGVRDAMRQEAVRPVVVPNGVDLQRFAPGPGRGAGPALRVLCVGEVREHKAQHVVVEAARGLAAQVRIVGPLRDVVYARRLDAPHVEIRGPVDDDTLIEEYRAADVLAHLSTSEALSLAVLEGMACGLPLVASDICEGQIEDGVNGLVVKAALPEAERVAATRAAFERLAGDAALRARMGAESRRMAEARFSWDAVAERLEPVYASARSLHDARPGSPPE